MTWWRDAVVYQLYVRSFADSDGDGIGDLAGLGDHLDHLERLGVDGLWLNPCYPSGGADGGYDVADYADVAAEYGGMPALDRLLARAHERGLRVLMDLVPNHCSVRHPWFVAALDAEPGAPERDRFIFRQGHSDQPPNNWRSVFGGPAWNRVGDTDQWYLHSFDPGQPDFDWRNPEVADMFESVLRFWFDRGIDGFRIDVAQMLVKHADLPDWPDPAVYNPHAQNQPEVHEVFRQWRRIADSYGRELTLVGEVWVPTPADLATYLRPDELSQAFYFDLLLSPWDAAVFRSSVDEGLASIAAAGATVTWTLANHDVHRTVSRFGLIAAEPSASPDPVTPARRRGPVDVARGTRRSRAALLFLLGLPGSVYLYQGEELGLPEVQDLPDPARQDPIWFRSGGTEYGRDGCRVPLPWSAAEPAFGFSPTGHSWLPQPAWFDGYAVSRQWPAPDSTLRLHAEAIRLRRSFRDRLLGTVLHWLPVPERPDVLAYRRGDLVCVTVFGSEAFVLPPSWGRVILSSSPASASAAGVLPGEAAAWLSTVEGV